MPVLKCSVGIQRKSGSGFQPLRRGKVPRPLFEAEPRILADIVSRGVIRGAFPKKGIRKDCGDTPMMGVCHCERSEAIFSIEIASSLALLAMTHLLR